MKTNGSKLFYSWCSLHRVCSSSYLWTLIFLTRTSLLILTCYNLANYCSSVCMYGLSYVLLNFSFMLLAASKTSSLKSISTVNAANGWQFIWTSHIYSLSDDRLSLILPSHILLCASSFFPSKHTPNLASPSQRTAHRKSVSLYSPFFPILPNPNSKNFIKSLKFTKFSNKKSYFILSHC